MILRIGLHIVFTFLTGALYSASSSVSSPLFFTENKGQWNKTVKYRADVPSGWLYLTDKGFTWQFYHADQLEAVLHHHLPISSIDMYSFRVEWEGGNFGEWEVSSPSPYYKNYFLTSSPTQWASQAYGYSHIKYHNLYPGIHMTIHALHDTLKYEFEVMPGADPSLIRQIYHFITPQLSKKGNLILKTPTQTITELRPIAYQIIAGQRRNIECSFVLTDHIISYQLGNYDKNYPLIIDPSLVFSTYTGSTADNWGFTATYDKNGNVYVGGIVFNQGYPTTGGAYQVSFAGAIDMGISKFSSNGSSLLYSTYIGGSFAECPHSIVTNDQNELYILGTTSSPDFPVISNGYDLSFNGGTSVSANYLNYVNGSDIVICRLNSTGTNLFSSTFIGGSGNDGLNLATQLKYNYGDPFRGEIIVTGNGNIIVASSTLSADFPVTSNAYDNTYNGGQEGIVLSFSPDLSTLLWSTFVGGTNDDAAYSVQLNSINEIYLSGGTKSNDFPVSSNAIDNTFNGTVDGYVAKLNPSASSLLAATYLGTSQYDQCYFVQIDDIDNVYVVGQTEGNFIVTPVNVWGNPSGGQFICKMNTDLDNLIFSLRFGSGNNKINITISAFLVNECKQIYVSGWGGSVNAGNGGPPNSNTYNMPVTQDAIKSNTDGSDFYLMVLSGDGMNLLYATYFGGNNVAEHCDGGTSRFDKKGNVYQAVCAGCGGNSNFPTTPGVWSNTNNSFNCNLAVFKMDVQPVTSNIGTGIPNYICVPPGTVTFTNNSQNAHLFLWDFGDGNTSTLPQPTHTYQDTGTFLVTLIAIDTVCLLYDTAQVTVQALAPPTASIDPITPLCKGDSIQLHAHGGSSYQWYPANAVSNSTIADPWIKPDSTIQLSVVVFDSCGTDTAVITVMVHSDPTFVIPDTSLCLGQSIQLYAGGGLTYQWTPALYLDNSLSATPVATPATTISYTVHIIDPNGCEWEKSVFIRVDSLLPQAIVPPDTLLCKNDSIPVIVSGGVYYAWSPSLYVSNPFNDTVTVFPPTSTTFQVVASNACSADTAYFYVEVISVTPILPPDTSVCKGDSVWLYTSTIGTIYEWSSNAPLPSPYTNPTWTIIQEPSTVQLTITDSHGCRDSGSFHINIHPLPVITAGPDQYIELFGSSTLQGAIIQNVLSYHWIENFTYPPLSCYDCLQPSTPPMEYDANYVLWAISPEGCINTDTVKVIVGGIIYVPSAFSPDGDGINDVFTVKGINIKEVDIKIFDRWGELIFHTNELSQGWDGTYRNRAAPFGVYEIQVNYVDTINRAGTIIEKVVLIR